MAIEQQSKKTGAGPGNAEQNFQRTRNYLQEVWVELKKTTWPTREEATRLTMVVIAVIIVLGFYMGFLDYLLSTIVTKFSLIK
ncbi:MAG TPA: preprotein translocase subunit SecE [Chthonomonadaceae bacterium]|nr:preprotein translocase subunit SecE [Chthonomonadaceae bacterium]